MLHTFLNDFYLSSKTGNPRVSLSFGPSYIEEGKNITLPVCHVTGFPQAMITWVKVYDNLEQSKYSGERYWYVQMHGMESIRP